MMGFEIAPIQGINAASPGSPGLAPGEAGNALGALGAAGGGAMGAGRLAADFKDILTHAMDSLYGLHEEADRLIQGLAVGEVSDLHQVMIAVEKANIALDLALQLRNKAIEAYQEIMRMQV